MVKKAVLQPLKSSANVGRQLRTFECDICGEEVAVTRVTSHEFHVPCRCDGVLSWAHKNPPPEFDEPKGQLELFG